MSICRNAIIALEKAQVPIYRESIARVIESVKRNKVAIRDISKNYQLITKEAKEMV